MLKGILNSWPVVFKNNKVMEVHKGLRIEGSWGEMTASERTRSGLNSLVINWQNLKGVSGLVISHHC